MPRHTDREINEAADRFERLADSLDVDAAHVEEIDDLRPSLLPPTRRGRTTLDCTMQYFKLAPTAARGTTSRSRSACRARPHASDSPTRSRPDRSPPQRRQARSFQVRRIAPAPVGAPSDRQTEVREDRACRSGWVGQGMATPWQHPPIQIRPMRPRKRAIWTIRTLLEASCVRAQG